MRRTVSLLVLAIVALSFTMVMAGEKDKVVCPVCGYMFGKSMASSAEHEGTVYYFCEPGCKAYFLSNPQVVTSGKTLDVVCGMEIDKAKAVRAEHEGREIHFCSDMCKDKYFSDPAQYEINYDVVAGAVHPMREMKHQMEFEGRTLYFVSDENKEKFAADPSVFIFAECPVSGEVQLRKDFPAKAEYKGTTYYFCGKPCMEQFKKDPESVLKHRAEGKYLGCEHGDHGSLEHNKKTAGCPLAKEKEICPHAKEHKDCPHAKEQKEDAKKGISGGCGARKDGRCYQL